MAIRPIQQERLTGRQLPSHLGGQDIYNGVTTNWGAGWENLGQSLGDFSFDDAVADEDSGYSAVESTDGLPSAFSTAAYMYEDSHGHDAAGDDYGDGGDTHITYYDAAGVILGSANVSTWSDGMDGGGTNTTYNGPNYNWLGNSFTDNAGSGYTFNEELTADGDVTVTFDAGEDPDDVGDDISITIADTTSYRVESGGFKPTDEDIYENTYVSYFDQATGSYLGGKETYGFGAEITIFGAEGQF